MEKKTIAATGFGALLAIATASLHSTNQDLQNSLHEARASYSEELTNRKKLEVESFKSCELVMCSSPRDSYSESVKTQLREACDDQCPRRQVLLKQSVDPNSGTVIPLLELTQFWQDGKLVCK